MENYNLPFYFNSLARQSKNEANHLYQFPNGYEKGLSFITYISGPCQEVE